VSRRCPQCGRELSSLSVRCACGFELPESRDLRSDPDRPSCGVCAAAISLTDQRCPACGADGYPARRARRGKRSLGAP
jgi:predicted amidophosphoribosyltransferase